MKMLSWLGRLPRWMLTLLAPMLINGTGTSVPPTLTVAFLRSVLNWNWKVMSSMALPSLSIWIS